MIPFISTSMKFLLNERNVNPTTLHDPLLGNISVYLKRACTLPSALKLDVNMIINYLGLPYLRVMQLVSESLIDLIQLMLSNSFSKGEQKNMSAKERS